VATNTAITNASTIYPSVKPTTPRIYSLDYSDQKMTHRICNTYRLTEIRICHHVRLISLLVSRLELSSYVCSESRRRVVELVHYHMADICTLTQSKIKELQEIAAIFGGGRPITFLARQLERLWTSCITSAEHLSQNCLGREQIGRMKSGFVGLQIHRVSLSQFKRY
jgi:hypothetical protein